MSKIAALVLASGLSRRYGNDDKLMAEVKGQALLAYCLDAARAVNFDGYYVVSPDPDPNPDPRADLARRHGFEVIGNPAPENGQGASLALGAMTLINRGFDATCVLLGDMPFVTPKYLQLLMSFAPAADIVFSQVRDQDQPPAIFRGPALEALTTLSGDRGAHSLDLSGFEISHFEMSPPMAKDFDLADEFGH